MTCSATASKDTRCICLPLTVSLFAWPLKIFDTLLSCKHNVDIEMLKSKYKNLPVIHRIVFVECCILKSSIKFNPFKVNKEETAC